MPTEGKEPTAPWLAVGANGRLRQATIRPADGAYGRLRQATNSPADGV
ncbi:hypothetical protein [Paenibacillus agaridevorans]|nr:hypothetical protein [Paenibacillus agaridevorans]